MNFGLVMPVGRWKNIASSLNMLDMDTIDEVDLSPPDHSTLPKNSAINLGGRTRGRIIDWSLKVYSTTGVKRVTSSLEAQKSRSAQVVSRHVG